MKRKDENGVALTNVGGWQSNNLVNATHPEFVRLKNAIEVTANVYHNDVQLKKTLEQKIENIWININSKGHSNEWHNHPKSILSGAFYLTGGTSITFQHPYRDMNNYFWGNSTVEEISEATAGEWTVDPRPNLLLIFPAYVQHKVNMNTEDSDRITFAFNSVPLPEVNKK